MIGKYYENIRIFASSSDVMSTLKVVIFEDEFLLAHDLKVQMQKFNYEVVAIFRKAEQGLLYFEEIRDPGGIPDIVLMDVSLAGKMSGIEAARIITERYSCALIFLTGMSQVELFDQSNGSKPNVILIKPFDIQQALVSIRLAIYQKTLEIKLQKYSKATAEGYQVTKKETAGSIDVKVA